MADTLRSDFIDRVKRTFKRDDKETELREALDDTIRDITARHSFQLLRNQAYVPLKNQQEDYPLPVDLLHFHTPARVLKGTGTNANGYILKQITKHDYDVYEPNPNRTSPSTGRPWAFAIWQNALLLTDIPSSTHETEGWLLEINYGKQPTVPTLDTQNAHPFGSHFDETVMWGILCRVFSQIGLDEEANKWGGYFEVGKPITVGGRTVGFMGGITSMVETDSTAAEVPMFVVPNNL